MPLPLLPGLQAGAPAPSDDTSAAPMSALAEFINGLDDSQIQELITAADEFAAANPEEPGAVDDEGTEGDTIPAPALDEEEPVDPDAEPAEDEGLEGVSVEDLDAVASHASIDVEDAATSIAAMQELANGDGESAPIVGKLVALAGKLEGSLLKAQKAVDKSVAAEDVQGAAQAGIDCRQFLEAIQALEQAAGMMSSSMVAPAATPQDHPALKAWAARVSGKAPALAI